MIKRLFFAVLIVSGAFAVPAAAVDQLNFEPPEEPLNVAVRVGPPFVIENADGDFEGITIELWEHVANELGVDYTYERQPLARLLEGMYAMEYDVGIGPITVTAERERLLDFTQPYYNAGLAIAVRHNDTAGWWGVAQRFFTKEFGSVMLALALVLLISGFILWIFERNHNKDEFSDEPVKGIGAGFWWAAVTMTTVGYGDKSPQTLGGRVVALIWMFTCVIIISSFTASIASSLTMNQLATRIQGPSDLSRVRVATLPGSFTAHYLDNRYINYNSYNTLVDALDALANDEVDAVVHDAPLLNFLIRQRADSGLMLLPRTFSPQNYAFTLTEGSPLAEPVNRALLDFTTTSEWQRLMERYMGEE